MSDPWKQQLRTLAAQAPPVDGLTDWLFEIEEVLMEEEQFVGLDWVRLALLERLLPTWEQARPGDPALQVYLTQLESCSQIDEPDGPTYEAMLQAGRAVAQLMDDDSEQVAAISELVTEIVEGGPPDLAGNAESVLELVGGEGPLGEGVRSRLLPWLDGLG